MTSQLRHNFAASQAVHGADDITAPHFYSQVNSLSFCGFKVKLLLSPAHPYSINFEPREQEWTRKVTLNWAKA